MIWTVPLFTFQTTNGVSSCSAASMDPVSVLGVAASVFQLVDFGARLISKSTELYKGSRRVLIEQQELRNVSNRLLQLSDGLGSSLQSISSRTLSSEEKAIQQISLECKAIAKEFTSALDSLLKPSEKKVWKSCRQAFKAMWNMDGLEAMQRRLSQNVNNLSFIYLWLCGRRPPSLTLNDSNLWPAAIIKPRP